jgi:hypothetical protein
MPVHRRRRRRRCPSFLAPLKPTAPRRRLRRAGEPGAFLPYESILGTLLHELAHNTRGPHDAAFYALLDALTAGAAAGREREMLSRHLGGAHGDE